MKNRNPIESTVADEELLASFARSEPGAASAFVRRFERRVFGLALTIVGESLLAEDVAQEAFVRAWRHAARFDSRRESVPGWLLTITRHLAIDAMRSRRPVAVAPDELAGLCLTTSRDPPDAAIVGDEVARLREALSELDMEQCRALTLAGIWGLTAREISEREGIPIGTAKTRIRTALVRLQAALSNARHEEAAQ